jgi:endonuclease/exonuclease/phosphatase family metal-dependent hydrolase
MRLLAWNVNHRTTQKPIPPLMAEAITSLAPDVIVLTEYVPGPSRERFLTDLASCGLKHKRESAYVKGQNHVLIASRSTLESGDLRAPEIAPAVPSNVLHVRLPDDGLEVLGLRIPDYGKQPVIRSLCWDWITATAKAAMNRPFVLLGDFNTDPKYSRARCGHRIAELVVEGWRHAVPPEGEGASYWTPRGHGVRIDHAFMSQHFKVHAARYVAEAGRYLFAGKGRGALSDHAALLVEIALLPQREALDQNQGEGSL